MAAARRKQLRTLADFAEGKTVKELAYFWDIAAWTVPRVLDGRSRLKARSVRAMVARAGVDLRDAVLAAERTWRESNFPELAPLERSRRA